jgi:NADH-quinone oxidoreductase subunit N
VFQAAVDVGLVFVVMVLTSLIGAFYYLRVVKLMYFDDPTDGAPIEARGDTRVLLSLNGMALLFFGIFPQQLMGVCVLALTYSY